MIRRLISKNTHSLCLVLTLLVVTSGAVIAQDGDTTADRQSTFEEQLEQLAIKCDELGLDHQAKVTRDWIVPLRTDQQVFYPFQNVDHERPPANAPQLEKFWYDRFAEIREQEAERLFKQALETAHDLPAAYRLLHRVLHENHRHVQARKILGYSDSTVVQLRPKPIRAKKTMPLTGWQSGQYYTIKTAHFEISTNATAADGARLARELEQLYSVWQQMFVEFWCDTNALKKRIHGENAPLYNRRIHQVVLFAEQRQYQQFFQQRAIVNSNSTGFYYPSSGTAFLQMDRPQSNPWVHEVVHQLFSELGPSLKNVGEQQNIWAIEGVANYMESMQDFGRFVTVGGFESQRLQYARYHFFVNQFYVPIEQLVLLDRTQLARHPNIVPMYAQFSGLTHFLMNGAEGKYRQAIFELLRKIYTKTDTEGSFGQIAGVPLSQIESEYREFLIVSDENLKLLRPGTQLKVFSAAHGKVTDKGLASLKDQQTLTWLDLTGCPVSDQSVPVFSVLRNLEEVTLDSTDISDPTVEVLADLPRLETLDLAHTKVTDKALSLLAGKSTLEVLYLTGTGISDQAAGDLETMVNLIILELTGTRMSDSVVERVKSNLPKLQQ